MQKRFLPVFLITAIGISTAFYSCTKIDTSTIGSDLLTVDNVNTFADTFSITAHNFFLPDSTIVQKADNYVIGNIKGTGADPLFGETEAAIAVQFKPTFYPFYFGNAGDVVRGIPTVAEFDSAVLCLSYKGIYGDSSSATVIPQTFEVRQIVDANFRDATDTIRKLYAPRPSVNPALLGSASITPQIAAKKVVFRHQSDSVDNQIRIPLNTTDGINFAKALYNIQDSTAAGPNNAFYNDEKFRNYLHGFLVTVNGPGNTLYYVNLSEIKSRLEYHFKKQSSTGVKDTIMQAFQMYPTAVGGTIKASSTNDYVTRNLGTSPAAAPGTNHVYLQSSPAPNGFADLSIGQTAAGVSFSGYSNRIIHRAFIRVEQDPFDPATDARFAPPPYLYLDIIDGNKFKPVYKDLNSALPYDPDATLVNALYHPYPLANVSTPEFGGDAKTISTSGTPFTRYDINVTRHTQRMVTSLGLNYHFRLFAPYNYYYPQYLGVQRIIPYYNTLAGGRVRVGSGSNAQHPMKLIVIYSKIK